MFDMLGTTMFKPVTIKLQGQARYDVVRDAHEALKLQALEWPIESSAAASEATRLCLKLLNDDAEPNDVRQAFVVAAKEAFPQVEA